MVPALELLDVSKSWGPVQALRNVSLTLPRHAVLGLVGENGAGKSTILAIINGTVRPSSGSVRVNGNPASVGHPPQAGRLAIATVFQEQGLIHNLPVHENILPGRDAEFSRAGFLSASRMIRVTRQVLDELELNIAPLDHHRRSELWTAATGGNRQGLCGGKGLAGGTVRPAG